MSTIFFEIFALCLCQETILIPYTILYLHRSCGCELKDNTGFFCICVDHCNLIGRDVIEHFPYPCVKNIMLFCNNRRWRWVSLYYLTSLIFELLQTDEKYVNIRVIRAINLGSICWGVPSKPIMQLDYNY